MTISEKIAKLEELLDLNEGGLAASTVLSDLDTWDSLSKLSLVALLDDEFSKTLTGTQIKGFVTVQDILTYMG